MKEIQSTQRAWLLGLGIGLAAAAGAHAESPIKTSFSGFGTLVGTITDSNDRQFIAGASQSKGADSDFDLGVDSRLGLQGRVDFDPAVSITGQVIAQRAGDKDFDPKVELLYGQYSGLSGLDLRLGRVVLPAFMVSDSRFVSYSLAGVRAPVLVYSMLPSSTADGLQAVYRRRIGPANWTITATTGNTELEAYSSDRIKNIAVSAEFGDWMVRYGYVQSDQMLSNPQLGDIPFEDKFHNVGVNYDNGQFFASAEYVVRKNDPGYFDASAWYVSAGARFGKWTPYATFSEQKIKDNNDPVQLTVAPGMTIPVVVMSPKNDTKGFALGVRYDVANNVALKAEYGRYDGASNMMFVLPETYEREKVNTLSVGLDFVF